MIFGKFVLFGWPLVVVTLLRLLSKPKAVAAAIIFGYLFLPTQLSLDIPGLPPLNKDTVPSLSVALCLLFVGAQSDPEKLNSWVPKKFIARILLLILIIGSFLTVLTNLEPVIYGKTVLQALRPWDAFSRTLLALTVLLPFLLGRVFFAYPEQQRNLSIILVLAGVIYSFLALYEVRMSPQLNNIVYGFFPHSWLQHVRGDGYRPLVFLEHGLWLSIFFAMTILAALGIARATEKKRALPYLIAGLWLLLTLVLSNSLGALIIVLILLAVLLLLRVNQQFLITAVLAGCVLTYPLLRSADIIPIQTIVGWAESISSERADSLRFRVINEDMLLARAQQKPIFGWGGWGRNSVFDAEGKELATIDGYWVLIIGQGGWARYLGEFGLLCIPVLWAALRRKRYRLGQETAALALLLTANLVDLVPNATITPITWMVAGALWGRLELGSNFSVNDASAPIAEPKRTPRNIYTRQERYFARQDADPRRNR